MNYVGNPNKQNSLGLDPASATDQRRNVLLRAAAGSSFQRTQRLKDFLLYVGTRALEGRESEISEHQIGIHVFERGEDFSPSEDNIVRTTARTLRVKLKEHFEGEGRHEPWHIEIPKGSYVPLFTAAPPMPQPAGRWSRALALAAGAALIVLACGVAWLSWRVRELEAPRSIFTAVMGDSAALSIVCSDSLHSQYQNWRGQLTPLEDYQSGQIFSGAPPPGSDPRIETLWPMIRSMQLSNQHDLRMAMKIARSLEQRRKVDLRYPRTLRMSDFCDGGDFLLLAARRSNPWVGLFEPNLNFQMVFPSATGLGQIQNLNPLRGEQDTYRTQLDAKLSGKDYARIGLVPGLGGSGRVLLVAGASGQATDAAAEVLLSPRSLAETERRLGRRLSRDTTRMEILVEVTLVGGTPRDTRIVSVR